MFDIGFHFRSEKGPKHLFQFNLVSLSLKKYSSTTDESSMLVLRLFNDVFIPDVSDRINDRPGKVFLKRLETKSPFY